MLSLKEKIFEKRLKAALEKYLDEVVAKYPSPEELKGKYTFSPEFEKRMEEIINGIKENM